MSDGPIHATAIAIGTRGYLFIGPSGVGKSSLAFACLARAAAMGRHALLVADDRVEIEISHGAAIARCPRTIEGLIELRHSDIVSLPRQHAVVLDYAVLPVDPRSAERLPPENEVFTVGPGVALPLLRVPITSPEPVALLDALHAARLSMNQNCAGG